MNAVIRIAAHFVLILGLLLIVYVRPNTMAKNIPEVLIRKLSSQDERQMDFQQIVDNVKVASGMKVLDIGSGTGIFTFRFAEALKNTGKVYSTEIDPDMVEYLRKEAAGSKYTNIVPVLVKEEGVDDFYKQNSFDVIFMADVLWCIKDINAYFGQLRGSLLEDKGRLYIISYDYDRLLCSFKDNYFSDFRDVIKKISVWKDSPFYKRLSEKSRDFIYKWKNEDVPEEARKVILGDINGILSDRLFFQDMFDYLEKMNKNNFVSPLGLILESTEVELVKWLFINLDGSGAFDKKKTALSAEEGKNINLMNYLIIAKMITPDKFDPPFKDSVYTPFFTLKKASVISKIESAGYKLVKEYDIPERYFLEFKRSH